jgi:hypothetical protein
VVGPDADRIAERLDATIKKTEALKASYEPPKVLAYGDLAEGMTVPLRWCDDDPS